MKSLTGPALDWAITFAAGFGFLLFGYGKFFVPYYTSECIAQG